MQDFKCETDSIVEIMVSLRMLQHNVTDELEEAKRVLSEIRYAHAWVGESALVGAAFLDLVVKYHAQIVGEGEDGPIMQAYEGFSEYLSANSTFYDEWAEYQSMKGI